MTQQQLVKWQEEASKVFQATSYDWVQERRYFSDGYIRCCQETADAVALTYHKTYPSTEAQLTAIMEIFK